MKTMKPFFVIWTGQALSLLGSHLVQFALVWWLTRATGSATALALASLAAILPQIALGPFAGALVDRWNRKAVMLAADLLVMLATLVLAGLFWLNLIEIWHIYVLMLVRASGAAFHWPAMQASTTLMVPQKHLARVGGINQSLAGLASILIPPLGALAIEKLPMQGVLAIDAATAIPAILSLLLVAVPQPARSSASAASSAKRSVLSDLRDGIRYIWGWKAMLVLTGVGLSIHFFGRAAGSLSPLLVFEHFQGGAAGLGWWQAVNGTGLILGGFLLGVWGGFKRKVVTQMLFLSLDGLMIFVVGLMPERWFGFALAAIFISGLSEAIILGLGGAIFQSLVAPEMQGRVFSLLISLSYAASPLGLLLAGPTADALGVQFWWVLTGLVFIGVASSALAIRPVARIEDRQYQPYAAAA